MAASTDDDAQTVVERDKRSADALSALPEWLLSQIAAFGGRDGYLALACVGLILESCARAVACAEYSEALAKLDGRYASYAELLCDDNRKNGMWCFDVKGSSEWTPQSSSEWGFRLGPQTEGYYGPQMEEYYANRVSRIARGPNGELSLVLEAYGEPTMNDRLLSSYQHDATRTFIWTKRYLDGEVSYAPSFVDKRITTPGHSFVVLVFRAGVWDQGPSLGYLYSQNPKYWRHENWFLGFDKMIKRAVKEETGNCGTGGRSEAWQRRWADAFRGRGPLPRGVIRRVFVPLTPPEGWDVSPDAWYQGRDRGARCAVIPEHERCQYIPFATPTSPVDWDLPVPVLARWRAGTWGM